MASHDCRHVVSQQRLSTSDDNSSDTELLCLGEESIKLGGRQLLVGAPSPRVAASAVIVAMHRWADGNDYRDQSVDCVCLSHSSAMCKP